MAKTQNDKNSNKNNNPHSNAKMSNIFARVGSAAMLVVILACLSCKQPNDPAPSNENPGKGNPINPDPGKEEPGKLTLTGEVTIAGAMKPNETLTINVANTNGTGAATYKWTKSKNGQTADIAGANAKTFVLTEAEIGYIIGAIVSYADQNGTISGSGGIAVVKELQALLGNVAITGAAKVNKTLTADTTGLKNAEGAASYQWKGNDENISGATTKTFKIPAGQYGKEITVVVTYSGNTGAATSGKTAAVGMPEFENVSVSITGDNLLGGTLSASVIDPEGNGWGDPTFAWMHDETDGSARGSAGNIDVTAGDIGKKLKVVAQYENGQTQTATDAVVPQPTFDVSLSGQAEITNPAGMISLTPTFTNVYGTPSVSYTWTEDGVAIPGASGNSLSITAAREGKAIAGAATMTTYAGWNNTPEPKSAGIAELKDYGENTRVINRSSLPDAQVPLATFARSTVKKHNWANNEKFAKVSIVFVDESDMQGVESGHRSRVNGITGDYELVVYINPVVFAEETAGFIPNDVLIEASAWVSTEFGKYNALVKAAPAKTLPAKTELVRVEPVKAEPAKALPQIALPEKKVPGTTFC